MPSKLFIEGSSRSIRVQESPRAIASKVQQEDVGLLVLTDHQGGDVVVAPDRIIDAVEDRSHPQVNVSGVSFFGYGVKIREFTQEDAADLGLAFTGAPGLVTVTAEDLARDIVVVVDVVTGEVEYTNSADPEGCTRRYVKIVKLAAEAKAIFDEAALGSLAKMKAEHEADLASASAVVERDLRERYGDYTPAELTALDALENGDREDAVAAAGETFVQSIEAAGMPQAD